MSGRTVHVARRDPVVVAFVTVLRILLRWAAGKHWHGRPLSDATFWRSGTQPLGDQYWSARGSWWAARAGKHRLAVRVVAVAIALGMWRWRQGTEWVLACTCGPVLGWLAWRAVRAVSLARHRRQLERPLSAALAPYLGVSPMAVESGLSVRPDYDDTASGEHVGALALPDHWAATPDQKRLVEQVIDARFGMDLRYQWKTAGYPMLLNLTRAPLPPALVPFAEVRELMEACAADKVLLGRNAAGEPRYWDTSCEDPMVCIHGGSRRGKTGLLMSIASQELRRGAERVIAIDPKRVGLLPLAGFGSAVTLLNDPRDVEGMWGGIAEFRQLVEDRYDALAADPTLEFRRALLICDEVSQFSAQSAMHWRSVKGNSDPALPPCWGDIAAAVWMGAACRAHVVVAGQRLDYQILGGLLGSFGTRLLAGYMPVDYARLVGVPPFQRSQKPRGRFLLYAGGELDWLQLVKVDDPDGDYSALRAWVLEGRGGAADLAGNQQHATGDLLIGLPAGAAHLGLSVDAFRKRLERSGRPPGEIRIGNQPAWECADLDRWAGVVAAESTP